MMDLSVIHSTIDDLELLWQLKANRWDPLREQIERELRHQQRGADPEEEEIEESLRKFLGVDSDYPQLKERVEEEIAIIEELHEFLGLKRPKWMEAFKWKHPLPDYPLIENGVEYLEQFIPHCRSAHYLLRTIISLYHSPKKVMSSFFQFIKRKFF